MIKPEINKYYWAYYKRYEYNEELCIVKCIDLHKRYKRYEEFEFQLIGSDEPFYEEDFDLIKEIPTPDILPNE